MATDVGNKPNAYDSAAKRFVDACVSGNFDVLRDICESYSAGVDWPLENLPFRHAGGWFYGRRGTGLHLACASGHLDCVRVLLDAGANVHATDGWGRTPLMYASDFEVLELLLRRGANVHQTGDAMTKWTTLHQCAHAGWDERAVEVLVSGGVDLEAKSGRNLTALMEATAAYQHGNASNHVEVAMELVRLKAKVDVMDSEGKTPLHHIAGKFKDPRVGQYIKCLIKAGAKLEAKDHDGHTPLFSAVVYQNQEACEQLIHLGADVNATNKRGCSLLEVASKRQVNVARICSWLIEYGARMSVCHWNKEQPLQLPVDEVLLAAVQDGHARTTREMIRLGADVETSFRGATVLSIASKKGDTGAAYALLKAGASTGTTVLDCNTALLVAAETGQTRTACQLLEGSFNAANDASLILTEKRVRVQTGGQAANLEICNFSGETALLLSAKNGHTQTCCELLNAGADALACNIDGETAVLLASKSGYMQTVHMLIKNGADINACNVHGETCVLLAAKNGHWKTALELIAELKARASADVRNKGGETALLLAAKDGHTEVACELVKVIGNKNVFNDDGETAPLLAAKNGHTETACALIKAGVDGEVRNNEGLTALLYAAKHGLAETAGALAEIDRVNKEACTGLGETALLLAAKRGHADTVIRLIEAKVDYKACNTEGDSALLLALKNGHTSTIAKLTELELVRACANLNAKNNWGDTALLLSLKQRNVNTAARLIQAKANVNIQDRDGLTALMIAATGGDKLSIKQLITAGAQMEARSKNGDTAVLLAAKTSQTESVLQLLEAGADIDVCNVGGDSVLSAASKSGNGRLCVELINRGAKVTAGVSFFLSLCNAAKVGDIQTLAQLMEAGSSIKERTSNGSTVLHIAVEQQQFHTVKFLIDNGAVVSSPDAAGLTPLHVAVYGSDRNVRMTILKLLLARGADPTAQTSSAETPLDSARALGDQEAVAILEKAQLAHQLIKAGGEAKAPSMVALRFGGPPGAGKSTLTEALKVKRFRSHFRRENQVDEGANNLQQRTKGINCHKYTDRKSSQFTIFDLGGHGEFLVTHQMFIGDGSVPVIDCVVVSALDDDLEQNAFKWCSLFASRNQPSSSPWPLLLIATRADKANQQQKRMVSGVFHKIKQVFGTFFCFPHRFPLFLDARKSWSGLTLALRDILTNLHGELIHRGDALPQPAICQKITDLLPAMKQKVSAPVVTKDVFIEFMRPHIGLKDDEQTKISETNLADLFDKALKFLSGYATVLSFGPSHARQYVVIDPHWLLSDVVGRLMAEAPLPAPYVHYDNGYAQTRDVVSALTTKHLPGEEALKMVADLGFCLQQEVASDSSEASDDGATDGFQKITEATDQVLNPSKLCGFHRDKHWCVNPTMTVNAGRRLKCKGTVAVASAYFPHLQVHFYRRYFTDYKEKLPMWKGGIRLAAGEHRSAEALIEADPANFSIDIIVRGKKGSESDCAELLHDLTEKSLHQAEEISPGSQLRLFFLSSMELDRLSLAGLPSRPQVEYSEERVVRAIKGCTSISDGFASSPESPDDLLLSHRFLRQLMTVSMSELPDRKLDDRDWRVILLNLAKGVSSFSECDVLEKTLAVSDPAELFVKKFCDENPRGSISDLAFQIFCRWLRRDGSQMTTRERSMALRRIFLEDLRRWQLAELLKEELWKAANSATSGHVQSDEQEASVSTLP